jgi:serine O-acetyltransferase
MEQEPILGSFLHRVILRHPSFEQALAYLLAGKLEDQTLDAITLMEVITECFSEAPGIALKSRKDIEAIASRDPACDYFSQPLLFFKGYHALQSQRISHQLWHNGRKTLALYLQSRISEVFAVDIHPAAKIGEGILLDHATGIVIGETAEIDDNVSILHAVTLGGTGKDHGARHPKIRHGVLIGAGAKILGNVEIGAGAKIGAGSVVLNDVPAHCTVTGVPAKIVGCPKFDEPALEMDHGITHDLNTTE